MQAVDPAREYVPDTQLTMPVPSLLGHFWPAGHTVQEAAPAEEYEPDVQSYSSASLFTKFHIVCVCEVCFFLAFFSFFEFEGLYGEAGRGGKVERIVNEKEKNKKTATITIANK